MYDDIDRHHLLAQFKSSLWHLLLQYPQSCLLWSSVLFGIIFLEMNMASPLSSNSSAFLALPVEIRRQIYRLCIPQSLRYDISSTLCYWNCPDWFNEIPDYPPQGLERGDATSIDSDGDDERQRQLSTDTDVKQKRSPFGICWWSSKYITCTPSLLPSDYWGSEGHVIRREHFSSQRSRWWWIHSRRLA